MRNLYEVLGVNPTASDSSIRKAYRKLAAKYHPDRNPGDDGAEARYREATEAYEVLSDPARRAQYDKDGTTKKQTMPGVDGEMLTIIAPIFIEVVRSTAANGRLKQTDLVDKIRIRIVQLIGAVEPQLAGMERALKSLQEVQGRFSVKEPVDGEENLLEALTRSEIRSVEMHMAKAKDELDRLTRAKNLVARYVYNFEKSSCDSSSFNDMLTSMKVMLSGTGVGGSGHTFFSPKDFHSGKE